MKAISFICCANKPSVLRKRLLSSLEVTKDDEIIIMFDQTSLASAYAHGEKVARNDVLVFVHQDVEMPNGWRRMLEAQMKVVERRDSKWGVLGLFGARWEWSGDELRGITTMGRGSDLGMEWGNHPLPEPVDALDSMLVVKRRGAPKFDPKVPTFHGAVEDLCMAVKDSGRSVWAIEAPVKHWSNPRAGKGIEAELQKCARYLVRKWKSDVPSSTRIWEHSLALLTGRSVDYVCAGLNAAMKP